MPQEGIIGFLLLSKDADNPLGNDKIITQINN